MEKTGVVRAERTEWRDLDLSKRHRAWGFNCPAVDLDFLMVEYNLGKAVAIVEYKHFRARWPNLQHPTYRALADLADNYNGLAGGLPFFVVFYWPEDSRTEESITLGLERPIVDGFWLLYFTM